jgi:NAD(P)-dependent dehydrogenase (short-subunit alcohol dehydrogenase family)
MSWHVFADGLLDGQVAIVTGGGSGLGWVAALGLAGLDARVVVIARRAERLHETAAVQTTTGSSRTPATSARRIRCSA